MKVFEGVYMGPNPTYRGKRCKVMSGWKAPFNPPTSEREAGLTPAQRSIARVVFADGETTWVKRYDLRNLSVDERPAYIESPEQAFAPVPRNSLNTLEVRVNVTGFEEAMEQLKENEMKTEKRRRAELLASLQDDLQTVGCVFLTGRASSKLYTYKVPAGWDTQDGDILAVHTPTGMALVQVKEVHREPRLDGDFDYKWAVGKVDFTEYHEREVKEATFLSALADAERARRRQEMLQQARDALGNAGSSARKKFDSAVKALTGK
jgi:hypothetical protein